MNTDDDTSLRIRLRDRIRRTASGFHYDQTWAQSLVVILSLFAAMAIRPFPFLHRFLPRQARDFLGSWTTEMIRVLAFSGRRRAFADQPATLVDPPTWEPRIRTAPDLQMTSAEVKTFWKRGFLEPFALCSREEMIELREQALGEMQKRSPIYQKYTGRDRHLDCPTLYHLLKRPELTERLAQLMGPNLLVWRSDLFMKPAGFPAYAWHQATTYLGEEGYRATLFPPDLNALFSLTAWIAFDDTDLANGCMQFVPGTHRRICTVRNGGADAGQFGYSKVKLEYDVDPAKVVTMEMKAGECLIFTERTIHGSGPNESDRRRWGMAFRVILPEVRCYADVGDGVIHNVRYLQDDFDLTRWGAIVIRGEDTANVNRILTPFPELERPQRAKLCA
jgi:non-heme Fe2+,alpha-ketoglutarate-dependent halogenase